MLTSLGVQWIHTKRASDLRAATHLLMPGVGHCAQAMHSMLTHGTADVLNELVMRTGVPVLGICLGMQLMTTSSEEGPIDCLGWFSQATLELKPAAKRLKVPNIGWHTLKSGASDPLLAGIDLAAEPFYFCHRYSVPIDDGQDVAAEMEYGVRHVAVLRRGNIIGVQFHPEKSQEPGVQLFRNFLAMRNSSV
jgi:glutamine amidotransferase